MSICIVSPRFHPVIGGVEIYFRDIASYCSNYMKTIVVTSNLKSHISIFEKQQYIKKLYDLIPNNVQVIRVKTLNNYILRDLFYLFQYINKNFEVHIDQFLSLSLLEKKKKNGKNLKFVDFIYKNLILQRSFANPNFIQIYYLLKKIHNNEKIKLIHSAPIYLTANIFAIQFALKNNIPYICTPFFHINPFADYIFYPSYQYILKKAKAVIACTLVEKEYYKRYKIEEKKIFIIPPGIDINKFKKPDINSFRNKFGIPEDSPLLLFMARRTIEKGFVQCINALAILLKTFKDIRLLVIGPITRDYQLYFNKLPSKLKSHIIDLGLVDENTKLNALANCDILVLPSLDDAFGIVYLEAWLFKKPVIGALGGNVEGLIDNNINGYLVQFYDIKALASKIELLLINDQKRIELGQNGYEKLLQNYKIEDTNKKILNLYRSLI